MADDDTSSATTTTFVLEYKTVLTRFYNHSVVYAQYFFKSLVKKQSKELAIDKLNETIEKHSKMDNIDYYELKMQDYLKNEKISVKQARILFKYRTRMARFWENFKAGRPPQPCPVCKDGLSVDTQRHSFNCKTLTTMAMS